MGSYSGSPGNWLILYSYDALGRLIRAQRPWPSPGGSYLRVEHYYYDGVRRVQEVFVDPLQPQAVDEKAVQAPIIMNLGYAVQ